MDTKDIWYIREDEKPLIILGNLGKPFSISFENLTAQHLHVFPVDI